MSLTHVLRSNTPELIVRVLDVVSLFFFKHKCMSAASKACKQQVKHLIICLDVASVLQQHECHIHESVRSLATSEATMHTYKEEAR